MDMKSYTVKEARANISSIMDEVSKTGEPVVVTKFGKATVYIAPIYNKKVLSLEQRKKVIEEVAGMWKDRKDLKRRQVRYDKIFD